MNKSNIIFIFILLINNSGYSQTYTVGSHRDEVLRIQGTPKTINTYEFLDHEVFWYGLSTVEISLSTQRVLRWSNDNNNLKVKLGANEQETLTPTSSNEEKVKTLPVKKIENKNTNIKIPINEKLSNNNTNFANSKIDDLIIGLYSFYKPEIINKGINKKKLEDLIVYYKQDYASIINDFFNNMYPDSNIIISQKSIKNIGYLFGIENFTLNDTVTKIFNIDDTFLDIPTYDVNSFLKDYPNAPEYQTYLIGYDYYNIPILNVIDFLIQQPDAKALNNYPPLYFSLDYVEKVHFATKDLFTGFNVSLSQFKKDMMNAENRMKLHKNLIEKHESITTSWDLFNSQILLEIDISAYMKSLNKITDYDQYIDPDHNW